MLISIILLVLGFFIYILDDIVLAVKGIMSGEFVEKIADLINKKEYKKKVKLSMYIRKELKKEDDIFLMRSYNEMKQNLEYMGDKKYVRTYGVAFVLFGIMGVGVALMLNNVFLIPVLGLGFALVPTWIVKIREYNFRKKLNSELSVALSAITTSYIRSNNIIKAVEENVDSFRKPVKGVFQDFVNRYKYIDKNLKNNIRLLSEQFNSRIFHLWCQELIVCQDDSSYKNNLIVVVSQYALDKETQDNLAVKLNTPIKETVMIIAITLLLYPLLAMFGNGTLQVLTNTFIGQVLSTGLWLVNIYAIDKAIRLSAPVE